ncbi:MAG: pilus assembly protein TadG-related protein [Aliihoeflea sp.]
MLRKFLESRSGNFAILSGVTMIPLCLAAGVAIDYSRHHSAQRHLQEIADSTSLALASTKEQNQARLEQLASDYLAANRKGSRVQEVRVASVVASSESVDVELRGSIPTTFMGLAGYHQLDVGASALAERATRGTVEVSLVLDNTKSMEATAGSATTRIAALKSAATELVDALLKNGDTSVRIALVPYADNVNVGLAYRNASWTSVPDDVTTVTTTPAKAESCTTVTTEKRKTTQDPTYACTKEVDGATFETTCGGGWNYETVEIPPKEVCTKAQPEKTTSSTTKWFGCIGSRMGGTNRLTDANSAVRYPGYTDVRQKCVTPIVRLTSDRAALKAAITGMVTSLPSYSPNTFIPAGLIWGHNTLSPTGPFADGLPYDEGNLRPRKVVVLMTDGSNTLLYRKSDGRSTTSASKLTGSERQTYSREECEADDDDGDDDDEGGAPVDGESCDLDPIGKDAYAQSNEDTVAICTNMKGHDIEIFTVAFMVEDPVARDMLKACATSSQHYFEAANASILSAAFSGIAQSLQVVRLAR